MSKTRRVVLTAGVCGVLSACAARTRDPQVGDPSGRRDAHAHDLNLGSAFVFAQYVHDRPFDDAGTIESVTRAQIESRYAAIAPRTWGLDVPCRLAGRPASARCDRSACGELVGHQRPRCTTSSNGRRFSRSMTANGLSAG